MEDIYTTTSSDTSSSATKIFLEPNKIFDQIGIKEGSFVADFGTGAGHFTLEAARRVGETGRVVALDILPQALESIESQASMQSLDNIETKRVNLEKEGGSLLEDASVNFVIAKDMLFMNEDKKVIMQEIFRVLVLGGQVLFVEWNKEGDVKIGPPQEKRIRKEDIIQMGHEVGFHDEKTLDVGDYHYGYVFVK